MKKGDTIYFIKNRAVRKGTVAYYKANRVDVIYRFKRVTKRYSFKLSETAREIEI